MFSKRGTLAVACLATAMLMLDIAVVNTALPRIARELHSGLDGLQWIIDAYALALATVVLTVGSLADRFGRRRLFAAGTVLFTGASLACALAGSIAALDAARAVQGIGAAMLFATSLALIADAFPDEAGRHGAFAAYGATIGASFALGPLVGGGLTTAVGWRSVFYLNLPLGALALAATAAWVRESRDPAARRIDMPGQLTLTAGLFLLVLALLRGNGDGWTSAGILAGLGGSVGLLGLFLLIERSSRAPMLPLGLFRVRAFTGAQIAVFAISASFFAIFIYTTLYLQEILHLTPIQAGLVYLPATGSLFVASGTTARLLHRVTPGYLAAGGLLLVSAGLAMLLLAGPSSSWTVLLPSLLLVGIGTGLFNPAVSAVALSSAPPRQSGLAAGVHDTFRQGGIAVGVAAFGALVPAASALGHGSAGAYVRGLHHAAIAGSVLAAAGGLLAAWLIGLRRTTPATTPGLTVTDHTATGPAATASKAATSAPDATTPTPAELR
ncbi:MAG: MFS transporter [Actinomycetota bacterium]